jgi:dihydroflavonol-4-reductase
MILVSGGTGMLGAHLLFELLKSIPKVKAIKRPSSKLSKTRKIFSFYTSNVDELFEKIEWIDADLSDYYSIENALLGATHVYHCAAMVSFNQTDRDKMKETNVRGTANLINACLAKNIEKLVHVSSIAALGKSKKGEITNEDNLWKNNIVSAYSVSKYQSELEVWRGIAEGLNTAIVNPSVILGPGDWSQGSPTLFPLVAKGMKFYTHATNGYVGVNDVCRAMILLMESPINSERFILNANNLSYLDLFSLIAKSVGAPPPYIEAKPWMLNLAWRTNKLYSIFSRKASQFNQSTAKSFLNASLYSSEKIIKALKFNFSDLKNVIDNTGDIYLNDQHKKIKN